MKTTQNFIAGICLTASSLLSIPALAAMDDGVIFERVATLKQSDQHLATITLTQGTNYTLTLTDFAFPDELDNLGVQLLSATGAIETLVIEKDAEEVAAQPNWGTSLSASKKNKTPRPKHSWGADFEQESVTGFLEAGTYYLSMFAEFEGTWYTQHGMYSVQMIATPVPASILFMASGLSAFFYMRRRSVAKPDQALAA
jgi:hypothetical protein